MSKNKSIKNQVQTEFMKKLAIGESHHKAKKESIDGKSDKIHSWSTYNNYVKHATAFGMWVKPRFDIKDIKDMRPYVGMYLNFRVGDGVSAWTVALDAAALAKLYGCKSTDFGVKLPKRERANVKRSRGEVKGFKEKKYKDVVDFCKGSGVRIHELKALTKEDIYYKDKALYVHVKQGKGGKEREVPVREGYEKAVLNAAGKCNDEKEKIFKEKEIPVRFPCHKYRAEYAKAQYESIARDISAIPQKEKYICRKDKAGQEYDKVALHAVSVMLGHNRECVVVDSYLY